MSRRVRFQVNPISGEPRAVPVESNAPRERVQALSIRDLFQRVPVVVPEDDEGDG